MNQLDASSWFIYITLPNQNLLIERTYRMSKREVTIDNINSLILSINIVEKRGKHEAYCCRT